jgi:hypothetical protein
VGETVDYSYCGTNTSDVDLEVLRVVDDRFGVLQVPDVTTVVAPGETLCNDDLGLPVSYEVQPSDAGSTIVNNAVVYVETVGPRPLGFQMADPAEVVVPAPDMPNTGSSGVPLQVALAALALSTGSLILLLGTRRRTSR